MITLKLEIDKTYSFVPSERIEAFAEEAVAMNAALHNKTGKGHHFLGWVELPANTPESELAEIEKIAADFQKKVDYVVVIGIGGSYLGAKSVIDALSNPFDAYAQNRKFPQIIYAGHQLCEDYMHELVSFLDDKKFGICVISKSGTTTEPAVAFRILKQLLENKVGAANAKDYIVAITDRSKGALRQLATNEGYPTFVIEDSVGGRYSVLSPVGLLPIAIAGFNIRKLMEGAKLMQKHTAPDVPYKENPAAIYAAARNALYKAGYGIEILVNYHSKLPLISEWWKQLYGESEGKEHKGIFPAAVSNTTDLHSMGQYIQDGQRTLFETVISVANPKHTVRISEDKLDLDKLNYLAGKRMDEVNKMAELGTTLAHLDGGVPNMRIELEKLDEYNLGQLLYFFEKACGISGYLLGVNPFDQPGVEDYKSNMFALLGKPGMESETAKLKERLK